MKALLCTALLLAGALGAEDGGQAAAWSKGALGARIAKWRRTLDEVWPVLRFGKMKVESDGEMHAFDVEVYLGQLDPDAVSMELYADVVHATVPAETIRMRPREEQVPGGWYRYSAQVSATRPAADYTARLIPRFAGVAVPLECSRILWQR